MNKAIILINLKGYLGGAQKRYLNLFNEISKRKNDYHLIINKNLFITAKEAKLVGNNEKIIIIENDKRFKVRKSNPKKLIGEAKLKEYSVKTTRSGISSIKKIKRGIIFLHIFLNTYVLLFKTLFTYRFKYVYAIWLGGTFIWPLKYLFGFKLIYSYMDSGFSSLKNGFSNMLNNELKSLKHADLIDFLSSDLLTGVRRRVRFPIENYSISKCSFINYEKHFPIYPKHNNVVFLGRMTQIKNPILFLKSILKYNEIRSPDANVVFYLIGNGELKDEIEFFIDSNSIKNIQLVGETFEPWIYLRTSKIFVTLQKSNNYPSQSLIEAMACENAIIATDVGETRKIVTENEGILVREDPVEIANAIIELIESPEKISLMGKSARNKVLAKHNADKYLEYFYSLESKVN